MKVTCLYGSPRTEGNSAKIANHFLAEAKSLGAEVTSFALNRLRYKGCQGCDVCKTKQNECALNDDLKAVLDAVKNTDVLVLATPVYYSDVTSQMKAFIDRTYSFVDPDYTTNPNASRLEKSKKLVFIQTQEAAEGSFKEIFEKYNLYFQFYGFTESRYIQACGVGQTGGIEERGDIFEQAQKAATDFCSG